MKRPTDRFNCPQCDKTEDIEGGGHPVICDDCGTDMDWVTNLYHPMEECYQ